MGRGLHDQDAPEARDQGGQEGGLRQGRHGEGEAGKDYREGLPRFRPEEAVLRASSTAGLAAKNLEAFSWVCHGLGWRGSRYSGTAVVSFATRDVQKAFGSYCRY